MRHARAILIAGLLGFPTWAGAADLLNPCQAYCATHAGPGAPAVLNGVQGSVLASTGAGYSTAQNGASLKPGDQVLVNDGSATVLLNSTCPAQLTANTVWTITNADGSLCAVASPAPAAAGLSPVVIAAGVAVVGAGVGIVVLTRDPPGSVSP